MSHNMAASDGGSVVEGDKYDLRLTRFEGDHPSDGRAKTAFEAVKQAAAHTETGGWRNSPAVIGTLLQRLDARSQYAEGYSPVYLDGDKTLTNRELAALRWAHEVVNEDDLPETGGSLAENLELLPEPETPGSQ